jgi:hypothetical protein
MTSHKDTTMPGPLVQNVSEFSSCILLMLPIFATECKPVVTAYLQITLCQNLKTPIDVPYT